VADAAGLDRQWRRYYWTANGADTLRVFFRGAATNGLGDLYLAIEDSAGLAATVINPDPHAVQAIEWWQWSIPLADLAAEGVNVTAVRKMSIVADQAWSGLRLVGFESTHGGFSFVALGFAGYTFCP